MGTCGIAAGAREVMAALLEEIEGQGVTDVLVTTSGCAGLCSREPMATVEVPGQAPVKYVEPDAGEDPARCSGSTSSAASVVTAYALAAGLRDHRLRPQRRRRSWRSAHMCWSAPGRGASRAARSNSARRHRGGDRQARPGRRGPGGPHRLPGILRRGARSLIVQPDEVFYCGLKKPDVPTLVEEHLLKGRPVTKLMYTPPTAKAPIPTLKPDPVLRQAEAGRPAQPRADRPRADRGLHRAGRLRGAGQGADRDDARADHPGDQALRPARARRRRLPHRHQVGDVPPGGHPPRRRAGRRLQRRRGRPRRVHGPQHHRERSARGHRGHDHRRARHRRHAGLRLHPPRVPDRPRAARARRSTRRASTACSARTSSARSSTSTSRSSRAPAPSSAASRRR